MKKAFITQPYLLTLNPSSEMEILWIQREPIQSFVEYKIENDENTYTIEAQCFELTGLRLPVSEEGYSYIVETNPYTTFWQCVAKIEGLDYGQKVFYKCISGESVTKTYSFKTAPIIGEPYRFAQLSDLQSYPGSDKIIKEIAAEKPDFLLYSGDLITIASQATDWFDLEEPWQNESVATCAFFPCLQQEGVELLQHCPIFVCPGNHELNNLLPLVNPEQSVYLHNYNWEIFMQLFRTYYPCDDTSVTGKRWYSVDYSDMHIISLSVHRWFTWDAYSAPGWKLVDSFLPDTPQGEWLINDLKSAKARFKWVIIHWHLLNKGTDVQPNLCDPDVDENGNVTYPFDGCEYLIDLFSQYGVNAVSYGHSHVYERYFTKGTHYIEAANFIRCLRKENAPNHPSGRLPVVEDNSKNSFLIINRKNDGLHASGYYASSMNNDVKTGKDETGKDLRIFDHYIIS